MGVRFSADDSRVCSVGGKDWALFQFKFVKGKGEFCSGCAGLPAASVV